jgi:hypothetical protein
MMMTTTTVMMMLLRQGGFVMMAFFYFFLLFLSLSFLPQSLPALCWLAVHHGGGERKYLFLARPGGDGFLHAKVAWRGRRSGWLVSGWLLSSCSVLSKSSEPLNSLWTMRGCAGGETEDGVLSCEVWGREGRGCKPRLYICYTPS